MKRIVICLMLAVLLTGCAFEPGNQTPPPETEPSTQPVFGTDPLPARPTEGPTEPSNQPTMPPTEPSAPTDPEPTEPEKKLVVIDAGHQAHGNYDKEPNGPGSDELKSKVTSGTEGVSTGLEEYALNLSVAQKLQEILEERDYEVVMIRTTHDVDISNAERAAVANDLDADIFIRIHANSSDDPETNGILTICQTPNNPHNADIYAQCKRLAESVLDEMVAVTGAKRLYVWETDTMSGINWCEVPVTIVEMGFMSCPWEDELMATEEYQEKIAQGIANGIDAYFEEEYGTGVLQKYCNTPLFKFLFISLFDSGNCRPCGATASFGCRETDSSTVR